MEEHVHVEPFMVIGLPVRTSDKFGKAVIDVGLTWFQFEQKGLHDKIPNRVSENMHIVYTDHEQKYMGEYTAVIGCAVSSLAEIPEGLVGKEVPGGDYIKYSVHGRATEVVAGKWKEIWKQDEATSRIHSTDFDVYNGGYHVNLGDANVDIYVNQGN